MGKRLHVQKKHVIEYADTEFFNWKIDVFNDLLSELYVCIYGSDDYCSNYIAVDREDINRSIGRLKQMRTDENLDSIKLDDDCEFTIDCSAVRQCIAKLYDVNTEKEDINKYITQCIKDLKYMERNSDHNSAYIHLDWF